MPSHGVPPPPYFHHAPLHVSAARAIAAFSKPRLGSPGTVQKRHTCLPVCASYAATNPRTPNSAPLIPVITLPLMTRGALVML